MRATQKATAWFEARAMVRIVNTMRYALALFIALAACRDATDPTPFHPAEPGAYGLVSIDGQQFPNDQFDSGVLVLHTDSTFSDMMHRTDNTGWVGMWGTYRVQGDSIRFIPSPRNQREYGATEYMAWASYDSVRVNAFGVSRLFVR